MPQQILVYNTKGGTGKSTLALNIADCLNSYEGVTAALAEFDTQRTLHRWGELAEIPLLEPEAISQSEADYLLLDAPPYRTKTLRPYVQRADFILIPLRPGIADVQAVHDLLAALDAAGSRAPRRIVFTAAKHSARSFIAELEKILAVQAPAAQVLATRVGDRLSYARSGYYGGIFSAPETVQDPKAIDEIKALTAEIIETLSS